MINENYFLITFASTHSAMAAEAFLKESQAAAKLIPLPSIIAAGCGFAIKIAPSEAQMTIPLLKHTIFKQAKFYQITKENGATTATDWVI